MDHAHACASAYLAEAVHRLAWTPAYRIELDFLQSGVRTLLELRALRPEEVTAIHGLYVSVSEVNRCLESLTRLYERASPDSLDDAWGGSAATGPSPPILPPQMPLETQRTIIKCQNVLRQLPEARAAAESALGRLTWLEPQD
ncbi:MAG TPA: hypothetical protein VJQ47_13875 [Steroidobacteraceae bacterium]|nr:hypothetical protein [Steroidobacteraceae bacterium]